MAAFSPRRLFKSKVRPASPPLRLSQFYRVRGLGQGSFGDAWLAQERNTRRRLVFKTVRPEDGAERAAALEEAELLRDCSAGCRHIVRYVGCCEEDGDVHIAMEYCGGGDVERLIGRTAASGGRVSQDRVLRIVAQALLALEAVHARGLVHRDVKAANLFITAGNHIRLGDFGIAKRLAGDSGSCSTPIGTPMYFAPELADARRYGQKADIWGLGCVAYELMALSMPFAGESLTQLCANIVAGRYARDLPDEALLLHYSEGAVELVMRMLTPDPAARPSASDLLASPALRFCVRGGNTSGGHAYRSRRTSRLWRRESAARRESRVELEALMERSRPGVVALTPPAASRVPMVPAAWLADRGSPANSRASPLASLSQLPPLVPMASPTAVVLDRTPEPGVPLHERRRRRLGAATPIARPDFGPPRRRRTGLLARVARKLLPSKATRVSPLPPIASPTRIELTNEEEALYA